MRNVWDEPKRRSTLATRGLDFASIDPAFFETAAVAPARNGRFIATGRFRDTVLTVVFAPLGSEAIAIISMRRANRRERKAHEAKDPTIDR